MKQQVSRLSPHQNGKVFGMLMAVSSLIFLVPFFLIFSAAVPPSAGAPTAWMVLTMPVIYLILGYLSVAVGCMLYNVMFKYLGGIEFESRPDVSGAGSA